MGAKGYGIIEGLADGVLAGVEAFRGERDFQLKKQQQESEMARKKQLAQIEEAELLAKGFRRRPDQTGFEMTEEAQDDRTIGRLTKEAQIGKSGFLLKRDEAGKPVGLIPREQGPDLDTQYKTARIDAMNRDREKDEYGKTPKGRLEKMGVEGKQKVGFLSGALQSLTRYEDEFRTGSRQDRITPDTPILGKFTSSTPIDVQRTQLEESIGRLASGGAISVGEEARFRKMIPTAADNDEIAAQKIIQLRQEFENKLQAYGLSVPELGEVGFNLQERGYNTPFASQPNRGLLKAPAGGVGGMPGVPSATASLPTPEDVEAIEWAKQNPGHPRSIEILKVNGVK
jgi:hypothetical protein